MQLGLIGLGKMGGSMRERLRRAGHEVLGYDLSPDVRDVDSLEELVAGLRAPRTLWIMVPHGKPTKATIDELAALLGPGDLIVEGGNSRYTDDQVHDEELSAQGIGYLDCGVSGGIWGLENGYGLMCGGRTEHVQRAMPIFDALRPEGPREEGFVHAGDVGAGHYAKMVHNGIEYGLMHAYAEGFELLQAKDIVTDVRGCFQAWTRGTVVRSWLLDLLVKALDETPDLEGVSEYTTDSGEGRWTVEEAIEMAVPLPVISSALFSRFGSRQENSPAMQAVAALRGQFGGHAVRLLDDELDDVHHGAAPKDEDEDITQRPGDPGEDGPAAAAGRQTRPEEAGPSSGTGDTGSTTGGRGGSEAGPTSGSEPTSSSDPASGAGQGR